MKSKEFFIQIAGLNAKELFEFVSATERVEEECTYEYFTNQDAMKFVLVGDRIVCDGLCWSREMEQNGALELDSWQARGLFRAMGVIA